MMIAGSYDWQPQLNGDCGEPSQLQTEVSNVASKRIKIKLRIKNNCAAIVVTATTAAAGPQGGSLKMNGKRRIEFKSISYCDAASCLRPHLTCGHIQHRSTPSGAISLQ